MRFRLNLKRQGVAFAMSDHALAETDKTADFAARKKITPIQNQIRGLLSVAQRSCIKSAGAIHRLQLLASEEDCSRSQPAVTSDPAPHLHGIHRKEHPCCFKVRDGASVDAEIPGSVEGEVGPRG